MNNDGNYFYDLEDFEFDDTDLLALDKELSYAPTYHEVREICTDGTVSVRRWLESTDENLQDEAIWYLNRR